MDPCEKTPYESQNLQAIFERLFQVKLFPSLFFSDTLRFGAVLGPMETNRQVHSLHLVQEKWTLDGGVVIWLQRAQINEIRAQRRVNVIFRIGFTPFNGNRLGQMLEILILFWKKLNHRYWILECWLIKKWYILFFGCELLWVAAPGSSLKTAEKSSSRSSVPLASVPVLHTVTTKCTRGIQLNPAL